MTAFTIISKPNCSFCDKAKALLRQRGHTYTETALNVGQPLMEGTKYMSLDEFQRTVPGARTVPQIFQDGKLIGGYTELAKLLGA